MARPRPYPRPARALRRSLGRPLRSALLLVALTVAACAPAAPTATLDPGTPTPVDVSTTRDSDRGTYRVSLEPDVQPIPLNEIHDWTITVRDADGRPVDGATVRFDGEMPAHQHGLPTVPVVGEGLGDGRYPVRGMKLQMGGHWLLHVDIESPAGPDRASFNIVLP